MTLQPLGTGVCRLCLGAGLFCALYYQLPSQGNVGGAIGLRRPGLLLYFDLFCVDGETVVHVLAHFLRQVDDLVVEEDHALFLLLFFFLCRRSKLHIFVIVLVRP